MSTASDTEIFANMFRGAMVGLVEGVKPGERVISEGQIKLVANALVRVDPNAGLKPAPTLPKE